LAPAQGFGRGRPPGGRQLGAGARPACDSRKIAPDFTAFFGCMYYSALRPEEALHLTGEQIQLPTEAGC
jgi:hypothetical protein